MVANVERAWAKDIGAARFLPHLSLHEFEAFALVAPELCPTVFSPMQVAALAAVRDRFGGEVERINDGETTHPSARIVAVRPGYEKPVHGAVIAIDAGLHRLEASCPHFRGWVSSLRRLG